MKDHPLLKVADQIEYMRTKGVTFNLMNPEEAADYLRNNNNYYRLRSYRQGFERISDGPNKGKYVNLDFAMLVDLATIDMHLRYQLMPVSLEVEHFFKMKLLDIVEDQNEDGIRIVRDFLTLNETTGSNGNTTNRILKEVLRGKDGPYTCGIIEHYHESGYPLWAFLELIPFGIFNQLWNYCAYKYDNKYMKDAYYLLQSAKGIRNACGHNNCILNDMSSGTPKHRPQYQVKRAVRAIGISKTTADSKLSNDRLIQLTTALYLHQSVASPGIRSLRADGLHSLAHRMMRHPEYYIKNDQVRTGLVYITDLIKAWFPKEKADSRTTSHCPT